MMPKKNYYESMPERVRDEDYNYPSVMRRLIVIFAYWTLALTFVDVLGALTANEVCTLYKQCN